MAVLAALLAAPRSTAREYISELVPPSSVEGIELVSAACPDFGRMIVCAGCGSLRGRGARRGSAAAGKLMNPAEVARPRDLYLSSDGKTPMPPRTSRPILLFALCAALSTAPLAAQTVRGTLVEGEAGVAGVRVVLVDETGQARGEAVTGADGSFTLAAPAAGHYRVRAERAGMSPIVSPLLPLAAGQTRPLRMTALGGRVGPVAAAAAAPEEAIPVAGVDAVSRAGVRGFEERRRRGGGTFFGREDIDRLKPARLADLFRRVPGLDVLAGPGESIRVRGAAPRRLGLDGEGRDPVSGTSQEFRNRVTADERRASYGGQMSEAEEARAVAVGAAARNATEPGVAVSPDGAGDCEIRYYVEGVQYPVGPGTSISDLVSPREVEALEVYTRVSQIPAQYQSAMNSSCGVVLIWLRQRV